MRILLKLLPLVLAIAALEASLPTVEAQSFTFTISAVQDVVKVGSKVRVRIELKNTSEDDISLTSLPCGKEDCPEIKGFRPVVKDSHGKEPPLTKWGRLVFGRQTPEDRSSLVLNAVGSYPLAPGRTYTTEMVVSNLYDLSLPDSYTIQIPYKAYPFGVPLDRGKKEENNQEVKPTVTVTVVR
jgi:hypothetical protein